MRMSWTSLERVFIPIYGPVLTGIEKKIASLDFSWPALNSHLRHTGFKRCKVDFAFCLAQATRNHIALQFCVVLVFINEKYLFKRA